MSSKEQVTTTSAAYPVFRDQLPSYSLSENRYTVRFARNRQDLEALQQLRFEVFNVELGEGLEESFETGRDADRFDAVTHHLVIEERQTGRVIGTYRMQTSEMARANEGFYSADEFKLEGMPAHVLADSVEVGRACIAVDHRNRRALFLLWKGLAAYMLHNHKRYLFGCCSLTSQDPTEGRQVMEYLIANGHTLDPLAVRPQAGWECFDEDTPWDPGAAVQIPKLFRLYLRYGAKVTGLPALDRFFRTIDYLVMLDVLELDGDLHKLYFD